MKEVGQGPRSGWLCPSLVSACFLVCGLHLTCCVCDPTVAPAGLGDTQTLGISAYWPNPPPLTYSPKPLQELLTLPSES